MPGPDAGELVRRRVLRRGPIPFDEFLDVALYHPDAGFYSTGEGAGRAGHFLTSPELGPLFGAVAARALDHWWEDLGRPEPFVVVEAGAGVGTLARAVVEAGPACGPALRYLMVEPSDSLRTRQGLTLALEPAATVLGPHGSGDGPRLASLSELPAGPLTGVVLANEVLDNLPFGLLERTALGWSEVRVGAGPDGLSEAITPAPPALAARAGALAPGATPGARIALQDRAARWLDEALGLLERGKVVVVDYACTTAEMAARPPRRWLRTYRRGGPGSGPLERPGSQDVTCDVCTDQLSAVRPPTRAATQSDFLLAHGLEALVEEARAAWVAGAAAGTLDSLVARSRVDEARALLDPGGLGGFQVLEWDVGPARP